jgi:hypothetical protein
MLNKLIAVAMTAVFAAAATGQLPHLIQTVRIRTLPRRRKPTSRIFLKEALRLKRRV